MDNTTIGQRAAEQIRDRATEKGLSIRRTMGSIGIEDANFSKWRKGEIDPGAYFLAKMLRAGFDIQYILIGERSNGKAMYTERDKGQPPL